MYKKKDLLDLIFFDIETRPIVNSFDELTPAMQSIWLDKYHFKAYEKEVENRKKKAIIEEIKNKTVKNTFLLSSISRLEYSNPSINEVFIKEAGLHAEFAKVYCISFGMLNDDYSLNLATSDYDSETEILEEFLELLHKYPFMNLSGYNIDDFDIPFVLKRLWINKILSNYPPQLQLKDAKPWTVKSVDHMKVYKAGSWSSVPLSLVCEVFGVPSPKEEFNNDEFTTLLLSGKITKEQAVAYCERDVKALVETMLKAATDDSNYGDGGTTSKSFYKSKTKA